MDIPRPLITQSRSTGGKAKMFSSTDGTRTDNTSVRVKCATNSATPVPPEDHITPGPQQGVDLLPTGGIRDASRPRQNFLKYFGGPKSHIIHLNTRIYIDFGIFRLAPHVPTT